MIAPEIGRIRLAEVIRPRMGWLVRWADIDGYERRTRVPDCDPHIARLTVAMNNSHDFAEFIETRRVIWPK